MKFRRKLFWAFAWTMEIVLMTIYNVSRKRRK